MKNKNKKILITGIMLSIFSICFVTSYAFFNYSKDTNQIITETGDIYMKLDSGSDTISLTSMFPETQSEADLETNNYIDFSIKGLNEYDKPIYYELDVFNGDLPTGYTEDNRIDPSNIMLELTDLDTNTVLYLTKYSKLNNNKIYVRTIKSTTEVEYKYRLRMWIDENVLISDTSEDKTYCASSNCNDSTKQIYKDLFASIKVHVYGDLEVKHLYEYNVMGTLSAFSSYKSSITNIYFIDLELYEIEQKYNAATIKFDITNTSKTVGTTELQNMDNYGRVVAWLEPSGSNYKLYIASDGYTYLSTGSSLFRSYYSLTSISFSNIKTNFVTDMSYMLANLSITSLNLTSFDTSNVINMKGMFWYCSSIGSIDLSNFNTSKVTNMDGMFCHCSKLKNWI